jgi:fructokinase
VRPPNLYLQDSGNAPQARPLVLGEVLWDVFPDSTRLGGAPLNFAAHVWRMGHAPLLISAVGEDELGNQAVDEIQSLGLDTRLLQRTQRFPTGRAGVSLDSQGQAAFRIERPAAYDAVTLSSGTIQTLQGWSPDWLYFGTLFASMPEGRATLFELLRLVPDATRLYDLNLRPGFDSLSFVCELLEQADVVKMNQDEMYALQRHMGLPAETKAFCAAASERFGWQAVSVTLGSRGCAVFRNGQFSEDLGRPIEVADTVGAGDAFAAAFLHGLASNWETSKIARFANRVGALVASRPGAIPDWTPAEAAALWGQTQ